MDEPWFKEMAMPHFDTWERMPIHEIATLMAILFEYYVARLHCDGKPLERAIPEEKAEIMRIHKAIQQSRKR